MRILPVMAALLAAGSLAACTVNTAAPPAATPMVVTPAPTYVTPSGPSVVVRP